MIATILATAVVFTGVVPAWEVAPGSMEHSQRTATRVTSVGGVPSASAAGFNDEQRAIAETWVSVACGAKPIKMQAGSLDVCQIVAQLQLSQCSNV